MERLAQIEEGPGSPDHREVLPAPARAAARPGDVTRLLQRWSQGEDAAFSRMMPLVYGELRHIARHHLSQEREGHTLQNTGLVHEAYLRLAENSPALWPSRAHFFGWVSTLMRHILIDHARSRNAAKRGGGVEVLSLDALRDERGDVADLPLPADPALPDLAAIDHALRRLERLDRQQGRVVELRYFCGLSIVETAEVLGISPATVKRDWVTARAWLRRDLGRASIDHRDGGVDP